MRSIAVIGAGYWGPNLVRNFRSSPDWDLVAVLPDTATDRDLDLAAVWSKLRDLRRMRIEVFPIRRRDFDENRDVPGELAEAVAREGRVVYAR